MTKQRKPAKEDVGRISFRLLDDNVAMELSRRAQAAGKSRHDLARDLVTAGLSGSDQCHRQVQAEGLLEEIGELRKELKKSRDLPSEAVHEVAEEIDQGLGAELRELRSDVIKLTAQISQVGNEAGIEQVLDELEELKSNLKSWRVVAKLLGLLRDDLATSVNILLPHAGKLTPEEARSWVHNTLIGTQHKRERKDTVVQEPRPDRPAKVPLTVAGPSKTKSSHRTDTPNEPLPMVRTLNIDELLEITSRQKR